MEQLSPLFQVLRARNRTLARFSLASLALTLLAFPLLASAEDFKCTDGKVYKGVEITRAELDGLVVTTDSGIEKIPFTVLPPELQKKYGFDAKKAAAYSAAVKASVAVNAQRAQEALKQANAEGQKQIDEATARMKAAREAQENAPGGTALDRIPDKRFRIHGTVIQSSDDGILIDCGSGARGIGYSSVKGVVLLRGVTAEEGRGYKNGAVVADGNYDYTTVDGAAARVPAYKVAQ